MTQHRYDRPQAVKAADVIRRHSDLKPVAAIFTGTGLGAVAGDLHADAALDYRQIPHFPASTAPGHDGRLVVGRLGECPVVVLQGRFHLYEGYSARAVTFPVRMLQALGVGTLVLTNASGGLNPALQPGSIMIVDDHINLTGDNPLAGPNDDQWGPRFPDMTAVYSRALGDLAETAARQLDLDVARGTYVGLKGPSLETPAEMRFLRTIGADAVGFSTVMEAIAAVHAGMQVLALSIVTNMNRPDHPEPASVEAIIDVARQTASKAGRLVHAVLRQAALA